MNPAPRGRSPFTKGRKLANLSGSMQKVFDKLDGEYAR
jgi:hypothetical protein